MKINIDAPIESDSVANIKLGANSKELFENYGLKKIKSFVNHPYYQIINFPLRVYIHKKNKIILSIEVFQGYSGFLNKRFKIGSSIAGLIRDPDWIFVDTLEGFISANYPNILIYASLEDPDIEELNATVLIENFYITSQEEWDYDVWKKNPRIIKHQIQLSSQI